MEELKAAVLDAEMVLIGVGEEMDTGTAVLQEIKPYGSLQKEIQDKAGMEWLLPFLFSHYLTFVRDDRRKKAYENLYELVQGKNYFVVTTCMDGRIEESSFDLDRITAPCGSYKRLQCRSGCGNNLLAATEIVQKVWQECDTYRGRLEQLKRPVCPICGQPVLLNHIQEEYQEEGYLPQWERYTRWLQGTLNKKLCVMELGVGMRYPTVIRWPFEKVAFLNQKAKFFRIHQDLYQLSEELAGKGSSIAVNSLDFLENKL